MAYAGSLRPLFDMMATAPSMVAAGATLVFGEEMIQSLETAAPMVVMVPVGGAMQPQPSYIKNNDPSTNMTWWVVSEIKLHLWAFSSAVNALPIDHATAVELLLQAVMQALQFQQAPNGLRYIPQRIDWDLMQNASIRGGRSLTLTVQVEMGIPDTLPTETTVTGLTINASI